MDGQRFDAFARSLALATDRRRFLKVLTAGISIAIMDRLGVTGQSKLAEAQTACTPVGAPCATGATCCSKLCAGGVCTAGVSCLADGQACQNNGQCCGGTCTNGTCGAGVVACAPVGAPCTTGATCCSGVCIGKSCQAPTCSDGVQNGTESDIDCGGGSCPPCANGRRCRANSDCLPGSGCCGGMCTPLTTLANCGACGNACPIPLGGQATCINGQCGVACPSGTTPCGSGLAQACVNLQADLHNCGACGSACIVPAGGSATCVNGQCVPTCPPQMHICLTSINPPATACAECCWYSVQTDCSTAPPANATVACTNGVCGFTCATGYKPCLGLFCIPSGNCCTALDCPTDNNGIHAPCGNNGKCIITCPPLTTLCGTTCCGGTCCPDGQTCCGLLGTCTPGTGIGDLPWGCCDSTLLSPEICGGVCCAPGKTCSAELFPHFFQACCGPNDTICGQDSACCAGTCCQDGHCCPSPGGCHNGTCCPTGVICNGVCGQICPNGTPGVSETCCPLGLNCCPTDFALGTGCCTATQICGQFGCASPGTV